MRNQIKRTVTRTPRVSVETARINCDYTGRIATRRIRRNEKQRICPNLINIDRVHFHTAAVRAIQSFFFYFQKIQSPRLYINEENATRTYFLIEFSKRYVG